MKIQLNRAFGVCTASSTNASRSTRRGLAPYFCGILPGAATPPSPTSGSESDRPDGPTRWGRTDRVSPLIAMGRGRLSLRILQSAD